MKHKIETDSFALPEKSEFRSNISTHKPHLMYAKVSIVQRTNVTYFNANNVIDFLKFISEDFSKNCFQNF